MLDRWTEFLQYATQILEIVTEVIYNWNTFKSEHFDSFRTIKMVLFLTCSSFFKDL